MGRLLVDEPPDPRAARSTVEFVRRLGDLRRWAGQPSLRQLSRYAADAAGAGVIGIEALPVSTASRMLRSDRLPRMGLVRSYVAACLWAGRRHAVDLTEQLEQWHDAWLALRRQVPGQDDPALAALHHTPADGTDRGRPGESEAVLTGFLPDAGDLSKTATVVVITGESGTGKTTLALHWARQLVDSFPDGQYLVELSGPTGDRPLPVPEALRILIQATDVLGRHHVPSRTAERITLYRSLTAGRRMLFVLDGAASEEQVGPLLPRMPGSMVMVTSRRPLAGLAVSERAHQIVLRSDIG